MKCRPSANGGAAWDIHRLIEHSAGLPVIEVELSEFEPLLDTVYWFDAAHPPTVRQLLGNGVIRRLHRPGERRAYYMSEPDPWQWMRNTIAARREREVLPVINALRGLLQHCRLAVDERKQLLRVHGARGRPQASARTTRQDYRYELTHVLPLPIA